MSNPKNLKRTYLSVSPVYDQERDNHYFEIIEEIERSTLERTLGGRAGRILDLGVGTGRFAGALALASHSVVGADLTLAMLARARRKAGMPALANADAQDLPFRSASFDLVYSFKVFAHIPDQRRAMVEVGRVLRVGGVGVVEFYNRRSLRRLVSRTKYFTRWQSQGEVTGLLQDAGFEISEVVGARALIPFAWLCRWWPLACVFRIAERWASRSFLRRFAGYQIFVVRRRHD